MKEKSCQRIGETEAVDGSVGFLTLILGLGMIGGRASYKVKETMRVLWNVCEALYWKSRSIRQCVDEFSLDVEIAECFWPTTTTINDGTDNEHQTSQTDQEKVFDIEADLRRLCWCRQVHDCRLYVGLNWKLGSLVLFCIRLKHRCRLCTV